MSKNRTPLQQAAKQVWESLLDARGHISDMRNVDGGEDPAYQVDHQLDRVLDELPKYMHEDDCNE